MAKTLEEIKKEVVELVARCPGITESEIGKQLSLTRRFATRLFDEMLAKGELCPS